MRKKCIPSIAVVILCTLFVALHAAADPGDNFEFVSSPMVSAGPNASTPLVGILEFSTNISSRATVVISDDTRSFEVPAEQNAAKDHRIVLLGLYPSTPHTIHLSVNAANGAPHEPLTAELSYTTPALPAGFPTVTTGQMDLSRVEPGVTLMTVQAWDPVPFSFGGPPLFWYTVPRAGFGLLFMVDELGNIVWYHQSDENILDNRRLSNGNIMYTKGEFEAIEIDMEGNVVHHYFAAARNDDVPEGAIPLPMDTLHHEIFEMPNGHFLALSSEVRELDGYPTSDTDVNAPPSAEPVPVVGDVIIEFNKNGNILNQWHLMDLLDPYIIGYNSLTETYWRRAPYEEYVVYDENGFAVDGAKDWAHCNSVIYDQADDTILVSSRHLDSVFKISRETGALVWILGAHEGWTAPFADKLLTPDAGTIWPYHQHAPMITETGEILLYDNAAYQAKPFIDYYDEAGNLLPNPVPAAGIVSRAAAFAVDDASMTVSQTWEHSADYFALTVGDADELPGTGNILVTNGGQMQTASYDGFFYLLYNKRAHIEEVTRDGDVVWEIFVTSPDPWALNFGPTRQDWVSYRSDRLASVYPN